MLRRVSSLLVVGGICLLLGCAGAKPGGGHADGTPTASKKLENPLDGAFPDRRQGPLTREKALRVLMETRVFAGSHVGYAGTTSRQVAAFRLLLHEPEARDIFLDLTSRAQLAGRLYGLCGLYLLDRGELAKQAGSYIRSQEKVDTLFGCVGGRERVSELVQSSAPNAVRLEPDQSLADWFKTHDSGDYDIVGGGLPEDFAGRGPND